MANYFLFKGKQFSVGSTLSVAVKIVEAGKERQQSFEGMLIRVKGAKDTKSITVRKIGDNQIGVERIWPLSSPWLEKIEVVRKGKVRRAKLAYLRQGMNQLKYKQ